MKNNDYNLVILHHDGVFETREEALQYITDFYKPNSLDAEPFIVKYKNGDDASKPNVILAFGTSNDTPGSFYAFDMAKIEEKVEELSNAQGEFSDLTENINDIISATGLTYDENKIKNKITYEPNVRDSIIGDAESIADAVDKLSQYIQENVSNSDFVLGESESVRLFYVDSASGKKAIVGVVKISKYGESDNVNFNNNIIGIKDDGIYAASHLAYDDVRHQLIFTTSGYKDGRFQDDAIVQIVDLGEHTDVEGGQTDTLQTEVNIRNNVAQITGNVRLSSDNSIVIKEGGLSANITVDVDTATNKLIVTIGNQTITKTLPGVELFQSAEYNDANEEIIITFKTGNTLVIPIHGLIHTWEVENDVNSPITLTKTVVTGGVDKLSANVKLRSTDNLIGVENGKLFVSETNIQSKINEETTRATEVENEIKESVQEVKEIAQNNSNAIQELNAKVDDNKFVTAETDTVKMTMVKETDAETRVLSSEVKIKTIDGEETNIIKSDSQGLYATVKFSYDKENNVISFNDGNGEKTFELNSVGIIEDAFYDSQSKSIVIIVKKDDTTTERINIPVSDLVNTWTVENKSNSPIILEKVTSENGDVLSANVSILDNEHNLLVNENGSLFVDSDSNSHLALFGEQATSVQGAINILKDRTDDIEQIKQDIEDLEEDNNNIKVAIADYQTDLANQKERITTNENNIAQLRDSEHELEVQVAVLTEKVNNLESRVNEAYDKATLALSKIEEMGDISSLVNRIENIENILRNLIDFGLYDTNN